MLKKKIKLVKNWRHCWKWLSVHFMAINTAIIVTWATLPEEFKQSFDAKHVAGVSFVVFVLGVIGRLIEQKPNQPTDQEVEGDEHFQ